MSTASSCASIFASTSCVCTRAAAGEERRNVEGKRAVADAAAAVPNDEDDDTESVEGTGAGAASAVPECLGLSPPIARSRVASKVEPWLCGRVLTSPLLLDGGHWACGDCCSCCCCCLSSCSRAIACSICPSESTGASAALDRSCARSSSCGREQMKTINKYAK